MDDAAQPPPNATNVACSKGEIFLMATRSPVSVSVALATMPYAPAVGMGRGRATLWRR